MLRSLRFGFFLPLVLAACANGIVTEPFTDGGTLEDASGGDAFSSGDTSSSGDGGTQAGFTVGGAVTGLTGTGLVLQDNGGDDLAVSGDGAFTFKTAVGDGAAYAVAVKTQPSNQSCIVTNGSGKIAGAKIANVAVACTDVTSSVGGTAIGLPKGKALVLQDNGADDLTLTDSGPFTFATKLASGKPYAVTVLTQPAGVTCTVASGSGTMGGTAVTNVAVTCKGSVTFAYTGAAETFIVPGGVTQVTLAAWGAQGKSNAQNVAGGLGGYATGTLVVTPAQVLNVYVGGGGTTGTAAGFNGGGSAAVHPCATAAGGGGGGASDVRATNTALSDRVIVGAGGGGGAGNRISGCGRGGGGAGGGGYYGGGGGAGWPDTGTVPTGGTQSAGGNAGTSTYSSTNNGTVGSLGTGGNGGPELSSSQSGGSTGAAGATGGGTTGTSGIYSGNYTGASGAGGASYIGGVAGGSTTAGQRSGAGQVVISW
ncbi:hypothetical protein BH09MYX1_BH09MYX1_09480 [soil metagenome]